MDLGRLAYDPIRIASQLLGMADRADNAARLRRGVAGDAGRLAKLIDRPDVDTAAAAAALRRIADRQDSCAGQLRRLTRRLTGLSAWPPHDQAPPRR